MRQEEMEGLLQELVRARGPSGEEDEVRRLCQKLVEGRCDRSWVDAAGNLIAEVKGREEGPALAVMAHLYELAMIVKRVHDSGSLRIDPLGGIFPFDIGQGPVEILGDCSILPGILSAPSIHTSEETAERWRAMPHGEDKSLRWRDLDVFTGLSPQELEQAGVHAGTRVVIARERRELFRVGPFIGGFFMDNRAAILTALLTLFELEKERPKRDCLFVFTVEEEIGAHGASFAARTLPVEAVVAIDVGPVAKEYQTELDSRPIIVYQDSYTVYDKELTGRLFRTSREGGLKPQTAIWSRYGSDASLARRHGQIAKAALLSLPTRNTHGFEIIHREAPLEAAKLLSRFLS